jgi:ferredoxin
MHHFKLLASLECVRLLIQNLKSKIGMTIRIHFLPDNVTVDAEVGEPLLDVAERAEVLIPTGCLMGSCHACTVELEDGEIIRACLTSVPPGKDELTINLFSDPTW